MPVDVDLGRLPRSVRAELRGLSKSAAEFVGAHLVMAMDLVADEPQAALEHAQAARSRAARLPVVREAVAEAAYAAADYTLALAEYRVLHRLTGSADYLPVMADCERALHRPEAAVRLLQGIERADMSAQQYVEALLVEAGARSDLGQFEEAQRVLRTAIARRVGHRAGGARLRYAYADLLERAGATAQARDWFAAAAALDSEGDLDAAERADLLDGLVLDIDEAEFEDDADTDAATDDAMFTDDAGAAPSTVTEDDSSSPESDALAAPETPA